MNRHPSPARCTVRRILHRGQAALILIGVLIVGSGYTLLASLNSASVETERSRITSDALRQAKEALIAYAVSDANRPGSLPCPDANGDGRILMNQDYIGSTCETLVGRFPWHTLGTGDLRDGSGEQLWYALSSQFQPNLTGPGNALNSNSIGSLTVSGNAPASDVVAIIFAPGAALVREGSSSIQSRGGDCGVTAPFTGVPRCNPANYLDRIASNDNADGDTAFVAGPVSSQFNDRLLVLTAEDLFAKVEIRAAREVAARLKEYFAIWQGSGTVGSTKGWYPWAAPFADPTNPMAGQANTLQGLLPMSTGAMSWTVSSFQINGFPAAGCSASGLTFSCSAAVSAGDTFTIAATLNNVATGFLAPPETASVKANTAPPGGTVPNVTSVNWSLDTSTASGRLHVLISGIYQQTTTNIIDVELSPFSLADTSWIAVNKWYQVLYYALDSQLAVDGPRPVTPPCGLTVNNAGGGGACAVVVTTGSALAGQARPPLSVALTDYLEDENAILTPSPADVTFVVNRRGTTFNDYVARAQP